MTSQPLILVIEDDQDVRNIVQERPKGDLRSQGLLARAVRSPNVLVSAYSHWNGGHWPVSDRSGLI